MEKVIAKIAPRMMLMDLTPYELSQFLIVGKRLSQKIYNNNFYVFIKFFSCVTMKDYNERLFIFFVVANLAMGFLESLVGGPIFLI